VEAEIAGEMGRMGGSSGNKGSGGGGNGTGNGRGEGEEIYLKATGRAIPRALEVGLHFQAEDDCWVKVEMGSVSAIDDIEVKSQTAEDEGGEEGKGGQAEKEVDDIPETRIRMVSSVTVTIGLK
jgi:ribonuclease P/MRP protein subunit POP7